MPVALLLAGFVLTGAALWHWPGKRASDAAASAEYARLREIARQGSPAAGLFWQGAGVAPLEAEASPCGLAACDAEATADGPDALAAAADSSPERPARDASGPDAGGPASGSPASSSYAAAALAAINPDYIGWISIPGTAVDYPVVQGLDNSVYLNTTFGGERNPAGSIFMDARCEAGFDAPVCILYGHNMKDGSMFAQIARYLEPGFMRSHPEIAVTTAGGEALRYSVFAARPAAAWDNTYSLGYEGGEGAEACFAGAPEGARRFLVLSTCLGGADKDMRVLVLSSRIGQTTDEGDVYDE